MVRPGQAFGAARRSVVSKAKGRSSPWFGHGGHGSAGCSPSEPAPVCAKQPLEDTTSVSLRPQRVKLRRGQDTEILFLGETSVRCR